VAQRGYYTWFSWPFNELRRQGPYGTLPTAVGAPVQFAPLTEAVVPGEQEEGFIIRDRRGSSTGADRPAPATSHSQAASKEAPSSPTAGAETASGVPVTFASFVISLGSSSLMLMGEQLDPQQPAMPVNLPQAKEIIDLLSVLDVKTKGNLTTEEQTVLRDMLYALRMKYVSLTSK
jgi:hypothetical protein